MHHNVIIIGSGAAGLSAAIYLARAGINTLVLGNQSRSQLNAAYDVENLFGFPNGITGKELLRAANKQAKNAGATLVQENVKKVEEKNNTFHVTLKSNKKHTSDFLIIAAGNISSLDFANTLNLKKTQKQITVDSFNRTSHEKVYAAGNCSTPVRQIAKDIGDGCNAAIHIIRKLKNSPNYTDYGPIKEGLGPN